LPFTNRLNQAEQHGPLTNCTVTPKRERRSSRSSSRAAVPHQGRRLAAIKYPTEKDMADVCLAYIERSERMNALKEPRTP